MQKAGQRDPVFVLSEVGGHCPYTATSELCTVAEFSEGNTLPPCHSRQASTA